MVTPWFASVLPFTLEDQTQFRAAIPPPDLSSDAYREAYEEVKTLGGRENTVRTTILRTPEQTEIAYFFADNAVLYWIEPWNKHCWQTFLIRHQKFPEARDLTSEQSDRVIAHVTHGRLVTS